MGGARSRRVRLLVGAERGTAMVAAVVTAAMPGAGGGQADAEVNGDGATVGVTGPWRAASGGWTLPAGGGATAGPCIPWVC